MEKNEDEGTKRGGAPEPDTFIRNRGRPPLSRNSQILNISGVSTRRTTAAVII
jgi:hypothetical protein